MNRIMESHNWQNIRQGDKRMHKIGIVTDSHSGITQEQAAQMGIHVLPMPFYIDGNLYFEDISLSSLWND